MGRSIVSDMSQRMTFGVQRSENLEPRTLVRFPRPARLARHPWSKSSSVATWKPFPSAESAMI